MIGFWVQQHSTRMQIVYSTLLAGAAGHMTGDNRAKTLHPLEAHVCCRVPLTPTLSTVHAAASIDGQLLEERPAPADALKSSFSRKISFAISRNLELETAQSIG